jgi:hypothetical protein
VVELKGAGRYDQGIKRPISVTLNNTERFRFDTWEGEGIDASDKEKTKVLIGADKTLNAKLVQLVQLRVVIIPLEAGTSSSSGMYDKGEEVELQFESAFGWRFVQWEGPGIQDHTNPTSTIKLDADATVVVVCEEARELVFDVDEKQ